MYVPVWKMTASSQWLCPLTVLLRSGSDVSLGEMIKPAIIRFGRVVATQRLGFQVIPVASLSSVSFLG